MHLDPVLDSFYILSSLWGGLTSPQVCSPPPDALPEAVQEIAWLPGSPAALTAFVNVNVVPMDTERVLADQTVLVQGQRIVAVGPAAQVQVPAGAVRIDGRGKYLMPGLADMHEHNGGETGEKRRRRMLVYLANGVTTLRHLVGVSSDIEQMHRRFNAGAALGPRVYLAPALKELPPLRPDSVAAYAAALKAAGYHFILVPDDYFRLPRDQRAVFDSFLTAAHRLGLPPASHTNGETFEELVAFGAFGGSVEHLHYAFGDLFGGPGHREQPRAEVSEAEIRARAAATKRAGTWVSVTMDCVENRGKGDLKTARQLLKALQDAGVGLLLSADADGPHGRTASVVHEELSEMVRAGLTPYQALVTGTRNVAQYFGVLDSTGTVAAGKRADLVLLSGNPLQEIRYTREPAGVMIQGRWLERATLDQILLDSPKSWFQAVVRNSAMPRLGPKHNQVNRPIKVVEALLDSLERAAPPQGAVRERLLGRVTHELGTLRAAMTAEQREIFDPGARVWMREHARRGHRLVVPGVAPEP